MATDRSERAAEAAALRAEGLLQREIAERMGISTSYASELIADPEGAKVAARRERYRGTCEVCGAPTTGSYGYRAPTRCVRHNHGGRTQRGTGEITGAVLAAIGAGKTRSETRAALDLTTNHIGAILNRLLRYGMIEHTGRGRYRLARDSG